MWGLLLLRASAKTEFILAATAQRSFTILLKGLEGTMIVAGCEERYHSIVTVLYYNVLYLMLTLSGSIMPLLLLAGKIMMVSLLRWRDSVGCSGFFFMMCTETFAWLIISEIVDRP